MEERASSRPDRVVHEKSSISGSVNARRSDMKDPHERTDREAPTRPQARPTG